MDSPRYMSNIAGIVSVLISLFWLYQITKRSGFFKTIYGRLMFIPGLVVMVGSLAKLEHWWWASYALILGLLVLGIIYFLRFIMKKNKNLLDVVKLVFLESSWILALAKLQHRPVDQYEIIRLGIFYLMIFLFAIEKPKSVVKYPDEVFSFEEK
jgi:uncharacterized membrane protein HdeD (DUF308 family)